MPSREPDTCVIIAALNAETTIRRAVRSALAEPQACEVIVVDDGSSDRTAEIARAEEDGSGRLKVIGQPEPQGPAAARNLALRESRAAYITPLDADDYFLPGRLAALSAAIENCDLVADDLLRATEGRPEEVTGRLIGDRLALPMQLTFASFVRANISRPGRPRAELGFLKPLIRRSFLDAHGLAYDERLRLGEDFILYAAALARGARMKLVQACGYVAVERADSLSARHSVADLRSLRDADDALAASLPLQPDDAAALRAHRRHVAAKVALREVLDARRAHGRAAGLLALVLRPWQAPYVIDRLIADRRARDERTSAELAPAPAAMPELPPLAPPYAVRATLNGPSPERP